MLMAGFTVDDLPSGTPDDTDPFSLPLPQRSEALLPLSLVFPLFWPWSSRSRLAYGATISREFLMIPFLNRTSWSPIVAVEWGRAVKRKPGTRHRRCGPCQPSAGSLAV